MSGWIVARTQPRRERWAAENLSRQSYDWYLPQIEVVSRRGSLTVTTSRPLFPSYIFIRFRANWHSILSTFGISSVIMNLDHPAILSQRHVDEIRARENKWGFVVLPEQAPPGFRNGQSVRVKDGTFMGRIGIYQGSTARDCEKVLLDLLGRKTTVLIGSALLESA